MNDATLSSVTFHSVDGFTVASHSVQNDTTTSGRYHYTHAATLTSAMSYLVCLQ